MHTEAIVFDAYGTLFDVHSVKEETEAAFPGHGEAISAQWRAKQLEYTWLRTLMRRYVPFHAVTRDALRYAIGARGLALEEETLDRLMAAYRHLALFPEVVDTLERLSAHRLAILTNGDRAMIQPAVDAAGLGDRLDAVITVDSLQLYKPDPRTYALAASTLNVSPHRVLFVSSNPFDAAGATSFGFRVAWINRAGLTMDELDAPPAHTVETLRAIPGLLG